MLFHAKKLVERVDFGPDLFLGLERHDDELAVLCGVQHTAKVVKRYVDRRRQRREDGPR